jgi:hypothetical protein
MTISTAKHALCAAALAIAVAALPTIYATAHPEGSAPGSTGRMSAGCAGMMGGGMMGGGMMGGGMMGKDQADNKMLGNGGMVGGEAPNQQWRR